MNEDFVEMLSALSDAGARYLIIGAHALAAHGIPRATGDLDLWVSPHPDNAPCVWAALERFGAPLAQLTADDLATDDLVFQIGLPPRRIDLLTGITGVTFEDAWEHRRIVEVGGLDVPVLGRRHLIENKRAVGRTRDIADVEELEALGELEDE